jgi:hypothetical protein
MSAAVKVLYISCMGRSGSTVFGNLIGEADGFFAAGELHHLWDRGLARGQVCGCGAPVSSCEIWTEVTGKALAGGVDPKEILEWQAHALAFRRTRRLLRLERLPAHGPVRDYGDVLSAVYRTMSEVTGASVIVDSSKWPAVGALLRLLPDIDPYFIHLVRDPRAVAYSRRSSKVSAGRKMRQRAPVQTVPRWALRNLAARAVARRYPVGRSMLIRYEDFVERPRETMVSITRWLGADHNSSHPMAGERTAVLTKNHNIAGNPSRFLTGEIEIALDERWVNQQTRGDRLVATTLAMPFLRRYHYPLRPTQAPS